ncbi:hypothetical protein [Adhaeribacter aquaticus]|uniref:hypothetical protein n=1 Tax=Adhaeribacter aquaticus TaxID=299567 RepID=UPI000410D525|nr:hypothetical protein [Adhaeribacter aquaticus]
MAKKDDDFSADLRRNNKPTNKPQETSKPVDENDFSAHLVMKNKPVEGNTHNYRTTGDKGRRKTITGFSLDPMLEDKLERDSYWNRKAKSAIINDLLRAYYEGKNFDEIPPEHRKK